MHIELENRALFYQKDDSNIILEASWLAAEGWIWIGKPGRRCTTGSSQRNWDGGGAWGAWPGGHVGGGGTCIGSLNPWMPKVSQSHMWKRFNEYIFSFEYNFKTRLTSQPILGYRIWWSTIVFTLSKQHHSLKHSWYCFSFLGKVLSVLILFCLDGEIWSIQWGPSMNVRDQGSLTGCSFHWLI